MNQIFGTVLVLGGLIGVGYGVEYSGWVIFIGALMVTS